METPPFGLQDYSVAQAPKHCERVAAGFGGQIGAAFAPRMMMFAKPLAES
jgi:hypothetical protein